MTFEELKPKVQDVLHQTGLLREDKLLKLCHLLRDNIDYYDWVGFYFRNGDKEELILGPYAGEPTDHTVIPFGKGICGQVAVSNQNFVVPDVQAQDNYIACSMTVKSEIVIPLFVESVNIGQIDIDSEILDPFTKADESFLEFVNQEVARLFYPVDSKN
jgi:L-methionine (R)-S-oxide reductase